MATVGLTMIRVYIQYEIRTSTTEFGTSLFHTRLNSGICGLAMGRSQAAIDRAAERAKERIPCEQCGKDVSRSNMSKHIKVHGKEEGRAPKSRQERNQAYYQKHRKRILGRTRETLARALFARRQELWETLAEPEVSPPDPPGPQPALHQYKIRFPPLATLSEDSGLFLRSCALIFTKVSFKLDEPFLTPSWIKRVLGQLHYDKFKITLGPTDEEYNTWKDIMHRFTQQMNELKSIETYTLSLYTDAARESLSAFFWYSDAVEAWVKSHDDFPQRVGLYNRELADRLDRIQKAGLALSHPQWVPFSECFSWTSFRDKYMERFEQQKNTAS